MGVGVGATGTGTATASALLPVAVGRQPIVDRAGTVFGFELLYRPVQVSQEPRDADLMTADVVLGALTIGTGQLVGDKLIFCNADRGVLTGDVPLALPPDRTVVEVLETVVVDEEVVAGCRELVARGYRLALDDFVWSDAAEPLLDLASIVKLDLRAATRAELLSLAERCRTHGVTLLAEKVETDEEVAWAREHGFELFQGYAIERPQVVHGTSLSESTLTRTQLALTLLGEDLDLDALEDLLRREPGLVVQVLPMASAGSHRGLRRQVRTVREALVLLGTVRIRQWLSLTLLSRGSTGDLDGLAHALVRARMCELVAEEQGTAAPDFAFTAGLLSALDLLLGLPSEELLDRFDLDPALREAAFTGSGPVGGTVRAVAAYQEALRRRGAPDPALDRVAGLAFEWAMPYVSALQSPEP